MGIASSQHAGPVLDAQAQGRGNIVSADPRSFQCVTQSSAGLAGWLTDWLSRCRHRNQDQEDLGVDTLTRIPPELVLRVLAYLDTASLCAAGHACPRLAEIAADASLWRHRGLTLCSQPRPPRPPAALHTLRVCSYRWPSPEHARRELAWLACRLDPASVRRLELVGRNLDRDTVRASVRLCAGVTELELHDVGVQDAWMVDLASLKQVESLHLDWHTDMSCQQMLQLASSCPSLRIIDTGACPRDSSTGMSAGALEKVLRVISSDLAVS